MERVVRVINMKDDRGDRSYWLGKSEIERLEAVEILRKQMFPNIEERVIRELRVFQNGKLVKFIDCETQT